MKEPYFNKEYEVFLRASYEVYNVPGTKPSYE